MPTKAAPALKKNQLFSLYRNMVLIRRTEERPTADFWKDVDAKQP